MDRRDASRALFAAAAATVLGSQTAQAQTCTEPCYPRSQAEIDLSVTPTNYAYVPGDVRRYGAPADGTTNARPAIQTAINVIARTGGTVYIPAGTYLIQSVSATDGKANGLVIPFTNVFGYAQHIILRGDGRATVLLAGSTGMTVIRWSDSLGCLQDLAIDGNSNTGVTGLSLIGSNTTATSLAEHVDWNTIRRVDVRNCTEGFELESPSAGGCYYNTFENCTLYSNTRHVNLRDNLYAGGPNRNVFVSISMVGGNTGFWIDGADTTRLIACAFEVINTGSTPSATPTAVHTTTVGSKHGLLTSDTNLVGCMFEQCTRDLDCNNRRISVIGGNCGAVGAVTGSAPADMLLGGDALYHLRELQLGGSVDGLMLQPRQIAFTTGPQVASSSDQSLPYPFNADGHLILQSRNTSSHDILFVTGSTARVRITGSGVLQPATDGVTNLGAAAARWNQVYAVNSTISTSDAREKSVRGELSEVELKVAKRIARLPRLFQWNESLAEKGENARLHCGVLAQGVRHAFAAEGLDPDRYAMNCADEIVDDAGNKSMRYSLRYAELTTFVFAAQEQRLAALEARA